MGNHKLKELAPMGLKATLETIEGVDDALKSHYTEKDGKFILQVEGVDDLPDVRGAITALKDAKEKRDALKLEVDDLKANAPKLPEGFTLEKWEKLKDGKADEAALIALRQELEAERDAAIAERDEAKGAALKNAVERDLTDALTDAGVTNSSFIDVLRLKLSGSVKIGDDGKPIVETDMGPLALSEHVKRYVASDEGKVFVDPGQGGGGKGGDGGGKPNNNNPLLEKVPALANLPEK